MQFFESREILVLGLAMHAFCLKDRRFYEEGERAIAEGDDPPGDERRGLDARQQQFCRVKERI